MLLIGKVLDLKQNLSPRLLLRWDAVECEGMLIGSEAGLQK